MRPPLAPFVRIFFAFLLVKNANSWSSSGTRRYFLRTLVGSSPILIAVPVRALDMDAFANSELSASGPQQMSSDEALCKFGQPSPKKGAACVRAGLPTSSSSSGGVDAFGNVDRGDFVRCTYYYELENDKYVKKSVCK